MSCVQALLSKRDIRQNDLAMVEMTTGNTMLMMAVIDNVAASVRHLLGLQMHGHQCAECQGW
jgi:hypothetical protein